MKPTRRYSRHGLNAVKARVKVRGLAGIDRRSAGYRALAAWRSGLVADLGGEAALSSQQLALVDLAARTRLYVDHLDRWLLEQASLVGGRGRRSVTPVMRDRQQLADALSRYLGELGLERRAPAAPDLRDHLAARAGAPPPPPDPGADRPAKEASMTTYQPTKSPAEPAHTPRPGPAHPHVDGTPGAPSVTPPAPAPFKAPR